MAARKGEMKMTRTIIIALLACGCTGQPDLYEIRGTMLHVTSAWEPALGEGATVDATMLLYGGGVVAKEFSQRSNGVSAKVSQGHYDALVFNGVMESEQETNLDFVRMRGTGDPATFEVCAAEAAPLRRLSRAEGEYIASNNMALFAFARGEVDIERSGTLHLKYENGRRVENGAGGNDVYVEFSPRVYNYRFRVRMTGLVNPFSAATVSGAVRGFAGSIFPATEDGVPRVGFAATHHLAFSAPTRADKTRTAEDGTVIGTVESQVFVTFGPALPASGGELPAAGVYLLDPVIALVDGTEFRLTEPIDITPQVNALAAALAAHHRGGGQITYDDNFFEIEVPDLITLPVIEGGNPLPGAGGNVDVEEWPEDEPVIIWI